MKKDKKIKRDCSKYVLIALFVLMILEVIMIPFLVYARIVKLFPVICFLVLPTLLGIGILLLSRNSTIDFNRRNKNNNLSK